MFLLLFASGVFFLVKMKTRASRAFLCLAVILVLFALSHVSLDVALAVTFSRIVENLLDSGSKTEILSLEQNWIRITLARQALLAINNAITDSFLATIVLGAEAGHKYNKTLEIICESSLLYFVNGLIYMIASIVQPATAPLLSLAWGSLAQVVNIVPMMIMVRVGMGRNSGEKEERRTFYGGNSVRYGMSAVSDVTTPLKGSGQY
ncbi:hypothetical protein B0H19DRAFT_1275576 [Mycena capillaripes]|nr:hypothetical protein B0H19DRAFT_1275576 [Mycena capillaripes]